MDVANNEVLMKRIKLEHKNSQLLSRQDFFVRMGWYVFFGCLFLVFSLGVGTVGYHITANLGWVDAFLNASMILTGMGQDGMKGSEAVVNAGGAVVAQDEASSVVWGMPGAVALAGLCSSVLPVDDIGAFVRQTGSRPRP